MPMLPETPATKGDIKELRDEMRTYYASKADLAELTSDLIKWMIGLMPGRCCGCHWFRSPDRANNMRFAEYARASNLIETPSAERL